MNIQQRKMIFTRILLWNARGFKSKKEEVCQKFRELNIGIELITEIKNKVSDVNLKNNNVAISGYNSIVINNYRNGQEGAGGVRL